MTKVEIDARVGDRRETRITRFAGGGDGEDWSKTRAWKGEKRSDFGIKRLAGTRKREDSPWSRTVRKIGRNGIEGADALVGAVDRREEGRKDASVPWRKGYVWPLSYLSFDTRSSIRTNAIRIFRLFQRNETLDFSLNVPQHHHPASYHHNSYAMADQVSPIDDSSAVSYSGYGNVRNVRNVR